jgi:uncharacterized protein
VAQYKATNPSRALMGRLAHGSDLLEELNGVCRQENVRLGRVEAIGAVSKARIGFYDQRLRKYDFLELNQALEIVSLIGNVSLKDGQPFVHAHVCLSDEAGRSCGGHLAPGTVVFSCEFTLMEFTGAQFEREMDGQTGLPLWRL